MAAAEISTGDPKESDAVIFEYFQNMYNSYISLRVDPAKNLRRF